MAEAVGKSTGRPGICFVTRGPGATNASAGIHIAQQDSTPMIMFVGQVETSVREREAFQELDYRAVFGSMTKWTVEVDDPDAHHRIRVARVLHRERRPARTGGGGAAEGHVERARRALPTRHPSSRSKPRRAKRKWRGSANCWRRQKTLYSCSAAAAGATGARRQIHEFANRPACRSRPVIAARRCSILCIRCTPATSVSGPIPSWWHAPRPPISWCWSAGVSARSPRRAIRCFPARRRKPNWFTSILAPRRSAASTGRISQSTPRRTASSLR